jgi:peroxiredoxin
MIRKNWFSMLSVSAVLLTVSMIAFAAPPKKGDPSAGGEKKKDTLSLQGKPAPDFTFSTIDGKEVKLSSEKGNVVLLDYWATWCPPCVKGLPHINEIANNKDLAAKGLKVWAINSKEGEEKVKPFLEKHSLAMTVPMDTNGEFGKNYLVQGIPTTVVVGRDGNIKKVFVGFGPGQEEQIKAAVEEALNEAAPTKPA